MLEPPVVAAGIARQRTPGALDELDHLVAEPQSYSWGFDAIDRQKGESAGVEARRPAEVGDRYHDTIDGIDFRVGIGLGCGKTDPAEKGQRVRHGCVPRAPSRSSKWLPTRSAFAMIVRVGFTAALDGKKLASTT